jgi:hypothetical protein
MPNYEVVHRFCNLRNKPTRCPAVNESDSRGGEVFGKHINDCFGKETECKKTDCIYVGGAKEPFTKTA